ncbi:angiotensin-converting enzyme-like [Convolutriloba macropyga]|uniref:angiotensin-converting enzyme-like n=1 Tax=Convolutriloba macropyga TaxID=536237 RepID=UPI003F527DD7
MSEKVYDGQSGLMSAEIKITAPNICFQFPIEKFLLTKDVYINKPYQFSIIQNWLSTPDGETRGEEYFDVIAHGHIADFQPLIARYLIGIAHQFQFLEAICKDSGASYKYLVDCNIDNKPDATQKFREMLSKGKSVYWRTLLEDLTGDRSPNPRAVLEYFRPLEEWLDAFIRENDVDEGWPEND